jgi:hypothetical protein
MDARDDPLYRQALDIVHGAFESGDSSSGSGATTILHRALTDLGNAERLIDRKGDDLHYIFPWKKWLVWDGTRWVQDDCGLVYAWTEGAPRLTTQPPWWDGGDRTRTGTASTMCICASTVCRRTRARSWRAGSPATCAW